MTPRQIGLAAAIAAVITAGVAGARLPQDEVPRVAPLAGWSWIDRPMHVPQRFARSESRQAVVRAVTEEAQSQGVPVAFALAVTQQESDFNPSAIGPLTPHSRGERAMGALQVLPSTARGMGHRGRPRDLLRPDVGARYGVRYMANALRECGGNIECAARRYHGGPNRRIWGPRTQAYARAVAAHYRRYGGQQVAQVRLAAGCPTADDRFPHTWGCR